MKLLTLCVKRSNLKNIIVMYFTAVFPQLSQSLVSWSPPAILTTLIIIRDIWRSSGVMEVNFSTKVLEIYSKRKKERLKWKRKRMSEPKTCGFVQGNRNRNQCQYLSPAHPPLPSPDINLTLLLVACWLVKGEVGGQWLRYWHLFLSCLSRSTLTTLLRREGG